MKKVVLGKGLDALIGREDDHSFMEEGLPVKMIYTGDINVTGYQPRKYFNKQALEELKHSIKEKGIIQPLVVRMTEDKFQLIVGERRLRAAKELGMESVPAIIREVKGEEDLLEIALVENIQREDLNPLERAESYKRLLVKFGLTQDMVAEKVGKDRSSVANTIRLLDLEDEIKKMIEERKINFGQAKVLLSLDDKVKRLKLARKTADQGISVRRLEVMVTGDKVFLKKKKGKFTEKDIHIKDAEERLRDILKTKVTINQKKRGGGKIEIDYFSPEELDRICNIII